MDQPLHRVSAGFTRRRRQVRTLVRTGGVRGLAASALASASRKLDRPSLTFGVRDQDVLAADLDHPPARGQRRRDAVSSMTINWVMTAPSEHSGGHTTTFRLIRHLQRQGHTCRVYLYDMFGGEFTHYEALVRRVFANETTEVESAFDGMKDADAVFATSWETAYPVFNDPAAGKRFYLVQDFEPSFYPASSSAVLAENTYRMGFHGVTAG